MGDPSDLIRLIEVTSDIAGRKKGASLGIEALKKSCSKLHSDYFDKFASTAIEDENDASKDKSAFKHAKYIDKVHLVKERLANGVKNTRDKGHFPIILSGDHASCAGTMHGLRMAHPDDEIGVVYIDAHADIHSPYTSPTGNMHGMPVSIACGIDNLECKRNDLSEEEVKRWNDLKNIAGSPPIKPENIAFCALRDCEEEEIKLIKKYNMADFSVSDITLLGVKNVVEQIFTKLSHCKHIYVSFDVDSVDPLHIPGTGTPVKNGLSYEQALQLNQELIKNPKVCCFEISEINPLYNNHENDTDQVFKMLEKITSTLVENY